jgi:hypothetical protein
MAVQWVETRGLSITISCMVGPMSGDTTVTAAALWTIFLLGTEDLHDELVLLSRPVRPRRVHR